ncbi:hypothetical protein SAMN05443551_3905 [Marivita hallyeonensis]|uniref:Glycosyl transferase family 2 n=2 Tax=Marivita hallyeonensis TaxID=996342 RepID=A0A1M5XFR7_9RHOB|nr:hypothetical protein SAMN05443551_3905 [Marivita hallyeonensis]
MLTISLTSIPPRFDTLCVVVEHLMKQSTPARVVVSIPEAYMRFPGPVFVPDLPVGIVLRRCSRDFGPATKLFGCLDDPEATTILYCDDDWVYEPQWAETLLSEWSTTKTVFAGSTFPVTRLKRAAQAPFDKIAQGFGGVLLDRDLLQASILDMPDEAYSVDDIWLSGWMAAHGIEVKEAAAARSMFHPLQTNGPELQSSTINGLTRAEANTACLDAVSDRFGIWPGIPKVPSREEDAGAMGWAGT